MPRVKTNLKREKLLSSAIEVFGEKGFKNTTVPDITKKAGLATGTFYNYFKDKNQLFIESLRRISIQLRNYIEEAFQSAWSSIGSRIPSPADSELALYATYNAFFDYVDRYRKQFLIAFREGMGYDPEFSNLMWDIFRELVDDTKMRLNTGLQLNIIRRLNRTEVEAISWAIVGALSMSAQAYMEGRFKRDELVKALLKFTMHGIERGNNEVNSEKHSVD